MGVTVSKESLDGRSDLERALREVLSETKFVGSGSPFYFFFFLSRYAEAARNVAEMIAHRPISAKDLFVRHSEFMARFGPLR